MVPPIVMPAKAGIHDFLRCAKGKSWIPAGACPCGGRGRHDGVGVQAVGQSFGPLVLLTEITRSYNVSRAVFVFGFARNYLESLGPDQK